MAHKNAQDAANTRTQPLQALDAKEQRFVEEYPKDLDPKRAALDAGYSKTTAASKAYQWVSNGKVKPHVFAAVQERLQARSERTQITVDMVLARLWAVATANPNELMTHRRVCCRHCFGNGHAYQWVDEAEYERAVAHAKKEDMQPPSDEGGYGFDKTVRPHPKCPRCKGEGYGDVIWGDTRDVSPEALALYAGVKQTKEGFEIKTQDQLAALQMVGRHLGMFNDKLMLQGDKENPLTLLLQQVAGKTLMPRDGD
jgi:phage terminase small subunit